MQSSQLNSIVLPPVGTPTPGVVMKASSSPLWLALRNVGPVVILLAHDQGTLQTVTAFANAYQLPLDREVVVVLAPSQGLYAAGLGLGAVLSIASSEAIPTKWMEA
jgi:hypothetical protein